MCSLPLWAGQVRRNWGLQTLMLALKETSSPEANTVAPDIETKGTCAVEVKCRVHVTCPHRTREGARVRIPAAALAAPQFSLAFCRVLSMPAGRLLTRAQISRRKSRV